MTVDTDITRFPSGALLVSGGVKADNAETAGGGSGSLSRGAAIGAAGVWTGVSTLPKGHSSVAHHHGRQATIVYLVSGYMEFTIHSDEPHSFVAGPGDFAVVPAGVVHEERNPGHEPCLCVVVRTNGESPTVVNVGPRRSA